jgi:hypothetical protein
MEEEVISVKWETEKNMVTVIYHEFSTGLQFTGVSRCPSNMTFNGEIELEIAKNRAYMQCYVAKVKKAEKERKRRNK